MKFPRSILNTLFCAALTLASATAAHAQVTVKEPWVRGTVASQKATGAFMQLSTTEAVRLVDVGTKRVLGPIAARKPSVWSEQGTYKPWDEQVAVGAELKIGYRLAEPDWVKVGETLGAGVNLYAQPFVLEVDVSIDGVRQTVRSPEFVREQVHMMAT
mgnify:CR=1 FL=1